MRPGPDPKLHFIFWTCNSLGEATDGTHSILYWDLSFDRLKLATGTASSVAVLKSKTEAHISNSAFLPSIPSLKVTQDYASLTALQILSVIFLTLKTPDQFLLGLSARKMSWTPGLCCSWTIHPALDETPLQFVHCFEQLRLLAQSGKTVAAEVSQPKTSLPDAWDLKRPVKLMAASTQSMPFKGNYI